ncbi:hypothetical protein CBOS2020_06140 [Clostridium botulinum]|nr:hypothetical protein CBOS2020_06140 [Clostridium botulinum]
MFIRMMIKKHDFSKIFHDEMEALKPLDDDIAIIRKEQERRRDENIADVFRILSIPFKDEEEKRYFCIIHFSLLMIYAIRLCTMIE